jgi:hypothetical protein
MKTGFQKGKIETTVHQFVKSETLTNRHRNSNKALLNAWFLRRWHKGD